MGASNFYNKNASKIFAVLLSYEEAILDENDVETGETRIVNCDENDFIDLKDNIISEMKQKTNLFVSGGKDDNDRNYYGTALGRFIVSKKFMGIDVEIELTALCRSAYYEGGNLDWEIKFIVESYDCEDIEETLSQWEESALHWDNNKGLVKANLSKLEKWLTKEQTNLTETIEEIYSNYSTQLGITAKFSNGETIYNKI